MLWLYAAAGDPSTVLPVAGTGSTAAILLWLFLQEQKERRAAQAAYNVLLERLLPLMETVASTMQRVLEGMAKQVETTREALPTPDAMRHQFDRLQDILNDFDPPTPRRNRARDRGDQ